MWAQETETDHQREKEHWASNQVRRGEEAKRLKPETLHAEHNIFRAL